MSTNSFDRITTGLIVSISIFAGFCVIGYQAYTYLYSGSWTSISVVDGLIAVSWGDPSLFNEWLRQPNTWIGLHNILNWVPSSVALIGFGISVGCAD